MNWSQLHNFKLADLKEMLKTYGLPTTGTKVCVCVCVSVLVCVCVSVLVCVCVSVLVCVCMYV